MSAITSITVIGQSANGYPETVINFHEGEIVIHGSKSAAGAVLEALAKAVGKVNEPKESEAAR